MMDSPSYLFKGLDDDHLEIIYAIMKSSPMEEGHQIFTEGQEAKELFVLSKGAVELTTTVENDFELPISILRTAGEVLGVSSIVPPYCYSLSARCVEKGELGRIDRLELQNLMESDHALGSAILTNLSAYFLDRLKETRQELKIHFKMLLKSTRL
jgi:CRP/FNR family transcriptional regulator